MPKQKNPGNAEFPSHPSNTQKTQGEAEGAGSFLSHLIELRNRLFYAVIAVGVVFIALVLFASPSQIYVIVAHPLMQVLPEGTSMIATDVTSPFLTPIKLTLLVALVISIPYVLYQIWAFVAPGLYRRERRLVLPLILSSTVLFYLGMVFAYFVVFPLVFTFFVATAPEDVAVMTDIKAYLSFVISMLIAFGVAFEVPVAVVLLTRMGVVDPRSLAKKRPYVVLWVFVAAAVLTPPDALSQTFLAIPVLLLFEIGLFFARRVHTARRTSDGDDAHQELSATQMQAKFDEHDREFPTKKKKRRE